MVVLATRAIRTRSLAAQAGFTAIELIVVLIVGLSIIGLAASRMDMLFAGSGVSEEMGNVSTLLASTKQLKTRSGYTSGTLLGQLQDIGGIPKNMQISGSGSSTSVTNTWGGSVAVSGNGAGFSIEYGDVPKDACIQLATKANKGGMFTGVKINGGAEITDEVTSAAAASGCSSANANTITWRSAT